jgi:hypothetical protein
MKSFARVAAIASLAGMFVLVPSIPPAAAHGNCTLSMHYSTAFSGSIIAWADYRCDNNHYRYLGQAKLQKRSSGSWVTIADSGTKTACCDIKSIRIETGGASCGSVGTTRTYRVFVVFVEIVNNSGNVGHKLTSVPSASFQVTC